MSWRLSRLGLLMDAVAEPSQETALSANSELSRGRYCSATIDQLRMGSMARHIIRLRRSFSFSTIDLNCCSY